MFYFLKNLFALLCNERGETLNAMGYDSGAGVLQNAIPTWWAERLRSDAINRAFWGAKFEGKESSRKPIIVNEDFTKKPGEIIKFNTVSQLFSAAVLPTEFEMLYIRLLTARSFFYSTLIKFFVYPHKTKVQIIFLASVL